jgi:hypothetical protein
LAASYDSVDLSWSWSGDFLKGDTFDLSDTGSDTLQSFVDQVTVIASSCIGDWYVYPGRGASLEDFVGEPNSRAVGERLHDRLRVALTSTGVVSEEDLYIRIVPVQIHKILIMIFVDAIARATNRIGQGGTLQISLVFDTIQRGVFFSAANIANN